jgi:hypothetical protein
MARDLFRDETSYRAEVDHLDDATPCNCGSCDWAGRYDLLAPISDCSLIPGDASPAGRCPECDSLAYASRPVDLALAEVRGLYDYAGNLRLLPGDGAPVRA